MDVSPKTWQVSTCRVGGGWEWHFHGLIEPKPPGVRILLHAFLKGCQATHRQTENLDNRKSATCGKNGFTNLHVFRIFPVWSGITWQSLLSGWFFSCASSPVVVAAVALPVAVTSAMEELLSAKSNLQVSRGTCCCSFIWKRRKKEKLFVSSPMILASIPFV